MTLPKLKSAWYSNRGCFSQGLCRICWMVAGSAITTGLFQFLTQLLQSKRKRIFAKLILKSVATALEIFFSKLVLSTVSHIFVATKLQS